MNWDQVQARWSFIKGKAREKWGKLTDDDLKVIQGRREQFLGRLQALYRHEKSSLARDLDDFIRTL